MLTQQKLTERFGAHVTRVRRYEAGANQPALEVLRALAVALTVSADRRASIRALIERARLRHQARRLARAS